MSAWITAGASLLGGLFDRSSQRKQAARQEYLRSPAGIRAEAEKAGFNPLTVFNSGRTFGADIYRPAIGTAIQDAGLAVSDGIKQAKLEKTELEKRNAELQRRLKQTRLTPVPNAMGRANDGSGNVQSFSGGPGVDMLGNLSFGDGEAFVPYPEAYSTKGPAGSPVVPRTVIQSGINVAGSEFGDREGRREAGNVFKVFTSGADNAETSWLSFDPDNQMDVWELAAVPFTQGIPYAISSLKAGTKRQIAEHKFRQHYSIDPQKTNPQPYKVNGFTYEAWQKMSPAERVRNGLPRGALAAQKAFKRIWGENYYR